MSLSNLETLSFNLLLFALLFCGLSLLIYTHKNKPKNPKYPHYHLACLLEDAPESALKGQAYPFATPLMTPFACIVPQTWHHFYKQNLGQPNVNYWHWKNQPEADNICQELTLLLTLFPPEKEAKKILENLVNNQFNLTHSMQLSFKKWHQEAEQKIGTQALKSVYQVCYQSSWDKIQHILDDRYFLIMPIIKDKKAPWWKILGVHRSANTLDVEKAYKALIRTWHPDLNQHPHSTEVTARINGAYQHYKQFIQKDEEKLSNSMAINSSIWLKIWQWLSIHQNQQ